MLEYVVAALVVCLPTACAARLAPQPCAQTARIPGGVLFGDTAFLANASSGIDAIDARTGQLRWKTDVADMPLAAGDDDLVAARFDRERPNVIHVLLLNPPSGAPRRPASDVELPPSVALARGPGGQLDLDARIANGRIAIDWTASAPSTYGASPRAIEGAPTPMRGHVELDKATGRVLVSTAQAATDAAVTGTDSASYWRNGEISRTTWLVDGQRLALAQTAAGEETSLALRTKDGDRPLARGRALVAKVSPDGRAIFVRSAESPPAPWTIFAAPSGSRVGTVGYEAHDVDVGFACGLAFVSVESGGGRPGTPAPTLLEAFDADARLLWTHPIRGRTATPRALPG